MVAESEKVYTSSVAMIFSSCLLATFFGIGSYMMYNESFQDAFIASIIGAVISCLFFYFFYYSIWNYFKFGYSCFFSNNYLCNTF